MKWNVALILTGLGLLGAYVVVEAFLSWHQRTFMRRHRNDCGLFAPKITRATILAMRDMK